MNSVSIESLQGNTIQEILQIEKQHKNLPEFKFNYKLEKLSEETVEELCKEILEEAKGE